MPMYTVFVREIDTFSSTHISSHDSPNIDAAKIDALLETCEDWSGQVAKYTPSDMYVMGVAEGDVHILEWDDD